MMTTSFEFAAFFVFVLAGRAVFGSSSAERWFLLVASLVFSLVSSAAGTAAIVFITVVDFLIGRRLETTTDPVHRKKLLAVSLTSSLGLLGFFKYTGFLLENGRAVLAALGFQFPQVVWNVSAPPGISFFTFASISYIVDVYNRRFTACSSLRDYGVFLSFFPKLLSGPITRASGFLPQLNHSAPLTALDVETGIAYLLVGAVKKLVIADQIAPHVNLIFAAPAQFDGFTLLQGAVGYAVQTYCDFSGYSDMAVGIARLLGVTLPENFQMPFSAATITEYWRRWHITMSNWFRDYVFFPLEMSRRHSVSPVFRTASNLVATFLVCGLWHGAAWTFVVWGGIHGVAMAIHTVWRSWNPLRSFKDARGFQTGWSVFSHLLTLVVVVASSVYFRAESVAQAHVYMARLLAWAPDGTHMTSPYILPAVAAVAIAHLTLKKDRNWQLELPKQPLVQRGFAYACLLTLLVTLGATETEPFVYFQF